MRNAIVVVASLLMMPALAMGTSLGMSAGGVGGANTVDVAPGAATTVSIDVVMGMENAIGFWDGALKADKIGLTVASRTTGATFAGWWNLDFGALLGSSLDVNSANIGYLEPTGNDLAAPGNIVAETIVLNVPALAPLEDVVITFVTPPGSGLGWKNKGLPAVAPFDTLGSFTIHATPEPMSLLLLGLGSLMLRRRRA